jgi:hypothetical protein
MAKKINILTEQSIKKLKEIFETILTDSTPGDDPITDGEPKAEAVAPTSGPVGSSFILSGSGLKNVSVIGFSGGSTSPATHSPESDALTGTVPAEAALGENILKLHVADQVHLTEVIFTVTDGHSQADELNQDSDIVTTVPSGPMPDPTVDEVTPGSGAVGQTIRITGTDLAGIGTVIFGGDVPSPTTYEPETASLITDVPDGAASGNLILMADETPHETSVPFNVGP